MSLLLWSNHQARCFRNSRSTKKSKLDVPQFRIGQHVVIVVLYNKYKYEGKDECYRMFNKAEVEIVQVDDEEPRYGVKPITGTKRPVLYFNSDEVWEVNEWKNMTSS